MEVLTDDPSLFCETLLDDLNAGLSLLIVRQPHKHSNSAQTGRLLRVCWSCACCQRSAERGHERAPLRIHHPTMTKVATRETCMIVSLRGHRPAIARITLT